MEEGGHRLYKILDIGSGFWVFFRIQGIQQILESLVRFFYNLLYDWTILWTKLFQLRFGKIHCRDGFELFKQGKLLRFFGIVAIEDIGEIPFTMPLASLVFHAIVQEVLLNTRAPIGK